MATDTMQAVSEAEKLAEKIIKDAKEESDRIINAAMKKSEDIIKNTLLEAHDKTLTATKAAKQEAENTKMQKLSDLTAEIDALMQNADTKASEASAEIKKVVMSS